MVKEKSEAEISRASAQAAGADGGSPMPPPRYAVHPPEHRRTDTEPPPREEARFSIRRHRGPNVVL
jgi:hypothetical protein